MARPQLALIAVIAVFASGVQAGPLWPLPKNQSASSEVLYLKSESFSFKSTGYESEILEDAFDRYLDVIFSTPSFESETDADIERVQHLTSCIDALHVYVQSTDQSLNLETDESYTLIVQSPLSWITASTLYGALHGLETFSQLVDRIELPGRRLNAVADWPARAVKPTAADSDEPAQPRSSGSARSTLSNTQINSDHQVSRRSLTALDGSSMLAAASKAFKQAAHILGTGLQQRQEFDAPAGKGQPHGAAISSEWQSDAEDSEWQASWDEDVSDEDSASNRHHHHHHHHHKHHHHHRSKSKTLFVVNATAISDEPRFRHRGLLIDTSRHFLPLSIIKDHLDAMAASKLNVLHWHLVDDPSFPMVSERLPLLSALGAFSPDHTYSREDMEDVVDYARSRGIRVLPEFDTPGHTLSWGAGYPDLLTDCFDKDGNPTGLKGPMDPTQNGTYGTIWRLLQEVVEIFPDAYLHLGGDEVPFDCWQSNPNVSSWMKDNAIESYPALEAYFEKRVLDLTAAAGRFPIVWQDVLDNGVELESSTIAHVWKWWFDPGSSLSDASNGSAANRQRPAVCSLSQGCGIFSADEAVPGWFHELDAVTKKASYAAQSLVHAISFLDKIRDTQHAGSSSSSGMRALSAPGFWQDLSEGTLRMLQGHRAIISAPWYLDTGSYAGQDWKRYYQTDPGSFTDDPERQALLVGGEAAMWGEYTDVTNSISKTWPRASAIAERLWSADTDTDMELVQSRLHHHRCRLLALGISAEAIAPGFCPQDIL